MACAEGRNVTALYALDGGGYVSYIVGAPGFVNEGLPTRCSQTACPRVTPLIAKSEGPPSPDPSGDAPTGDDVPKFVAGRACAAMIAVGFNLVVYEGGSVGDLDACAQGAGLAALYVLDGGVWVSYILGAPELVNAAFRELFGDGLPVATPLVGKSDGP